MHEIKTMRWYSKRSSGRCSIEEITSAIKKIKLGKASGLSEMSMKIIHAIRKVEIDVMIELCQRVLDVKGILENWKTSVMMPIYKEKGDVMNCDAYKKSEVIKTWNEDC